MIEFSIVEMYNLQEAVVTSYSCEPVASNSEHANPAPLSLENIPLSDNCPDPIPIVEEIKVSQAEPQNNVSGIATSLGPRHSFATCLKESLVSVVRVSLGIPRLLYIPHTLSENGRLFMKK